MFDEEYNDYEEYENPTLNTNNEEYLEQVKDHLARANWQAIKQNGINFAYYRSEDDKIDTLVEIIKETIAYFEEIEEYEKCADLKRALDHL
jgi:hypothetical protein